IAILFSAIITLSFVFYANAQKIYASINNSSNFSCADHVCIKEKGFQLNDITNPNTPTTGLKFNIFYFGTGNASSKDDRFGELSPGPFIDIGVGELVSDGHGNWKEIGNGFLIGTFEKMPNYM